MQNPHVISYEGYFRVKPNDPLAQHLRPGVQIISERVTGKPLSYYWAIHDGNNPIAKLLNRKAIKDSFKVSREGDYWKIKQAGIILHDAHPGNIIFDPITKNYKHIDLAGYIFEP